VVTKGGAKLTAGGTTAWTSSGLGHLRVNNSALGVFADRLTKVADRPVIDSTGIAGTYDFDLTIDSELSTALADAIPMLSTALSEIGLKLEKRTVQIEFLVVDRAEKAPTEN